MRCLGLRLAASGVCWLLGGLGSLWPWPTAPAWAESGVRCWPGRLSGAVFGVGLRAGDSVAWLGVRHGVHPVRLQRVRRGWVRVDTRRVTPRFAAQVQGVVLNVPECHVYLVHDGQVERDYPVAVSTPDRPVPIGSTRVVSKEKNPTWFVPASIQKEMASRGQRVTLEVPPGPDNPLGPRWIGIWRGQFGMHGTNAPLSIKRYASHGCVRFRAADIKDLYERVWVGTPVHVVYEPVLLAVAGRDIWLSAYPDVYETGLDYAAQLRRLARSAGVLGRLDWAKAAQAFRFRDGIVREVSRGRATAPAPVVVTPAPVPAEVDAPPVRHDGEHPGEAEEPSPAAPLEGAPFDPSLEGWETGDWNRP
ncbi:MAG: L,D-transpeptidase [Candidatus Sericytochromatia bacterium]|nr:L,D-transpeptidase [Candidatus Sericytochromatia bacterium]